jgi:hypothetical protein
LCFVYAAFETDVVVVDFVGVMDAVGVKQMRVGFFFV